MHLHTVVIRAVLGMTTRLHVQLRARVYRRLLLLLRTKALPTMSFFYTPIHMQFRYQTNERWGYWVVESNKFWNRSPELEHKYSPTSDHVVGKTRRKKNHPSVHHHAHTELVAITRAKRASPILPVWTECDDNAPDVDRVDGLSEANIWMFLKYVLWFVGDAHEASLPPKKVLG